MLYLLAIIELGVLIIIHEGGHFLLARLSKMRVERFSIGFGPALFKFRRGETIFQISAIPLGGYVQIAGLNPGDETPADDPRAYPNRPVWQRLLTIFAGPGTNYVFAALLMAAICLVWGVQQPSKIPMVGELVEGKPAAAAGMQPGDELVSIDQKHIDDVDEVSKLIDASHGKPITVVVQRDGVPKTIHVTPVQLDGHWRVGINLWAKPIRVHGTVGEALSEGFVWPYRQTVGILQGFRDIFAGRQKAEFSGPVGIVKVMKQQVARGPDHALEIMAIISVYLGLFNLLPFPALDGGRLVFLLYEALSRRRVNQRVEQTVHMVGMVVLLCFVVWVTLGHDLRGVFHR